ncbi:hypothetical protein [Pseudactinotalea sp.]|uniref:hypothetical protein n=1 Tax=Pseudactinotalea sp. TaxID=1926260 RepID=UPI003B3BC3A8
MANDDTEFIDIEIGPFGQASRVWRRRIRQLRFWKAGILFSVFWVIMFATSYLEAYAISTADDLVGSTCSEGPEALPFCLTGLILGWGMSVGAHLGMAAAIAFVVYAYAYVLKGVVAYLPVFASTIVTIALFWVGIAWKPAELLLVDVVVHLYPQSLRDGYASVVGWSAPIASALMSLFTLFVGGLQVWVVGRLGLGIWRKGDEYRGSVFYKKWSAPAEAYPGVRDVFGEFLSRFRSANPSSCLPGSRDLEPDGSDGVSKGPVLWAGRGSQGEAGRRPLNPAQRQKKDKSRRASRAAKVARRLHR